MRPIVSVVIPTLRRPAVVQGAVRSVLEQSITDLELIVVIDGPDDATRAALENIADERLRIVQHDANGGVGRARNTGIEASAAPWIALLDDDDLWRPRKLERQLDRARSADAGWIMCDSVNFDSRSLEVLSYNEIGPLDALPVRLRSGGALHAGPSAALIDRSVVDAVGGFDEDLAANEDLDLWIRLADVLTCTNVDEALVAYRIWPLSMSTDVRAMRAAGEALRDKYGGTAPIEIRGSRYLARQALAGGNRFQAAAEFMRSAHVHRSPADVARAGAAVVAPDWLKGVGRRRTAAAIPADTKSEFQSWLQDRVEVAA